MRPILPTAVALLVTAPAAAADVTAAPDLTFEGTPKPVAVAVGDFDEDGRQDLAVADRDGNRVHLRFGNGDGTFRAGPPIVNLTRPHALVVADVTGDGTADLAVAAGFPPQQAVVVLRGTGTGSFAYETGFQVPGAFARTLAAGDFDGDGRADLVAAATKHLSVRLTGPNGTFTGGIDVHPGGNPNREPLDVAVGDFDANGTDDLAVTTAKLAPTDTATLMVMPGRGDGGFGPTALAALPEASLDLATGDLDADGREDVVAPMLAADAVGVRLGDGQGRLPDGPASVPAGDGPRAVAVADLDGDGREDLAVANRADQSVTVHRGDGGGGFGAGEELAVGSQPVALAAGDFDGDGRADLAVANELGATVSVRLGAGATPLAGSLLVNGGFEQGVGVGRSGQQRPIPGWTTTAGTTFARYGATPLIGFPSLLDAPRFQTGGAGFLWGGEGAGGSATQAVDVAASSVAIDCGRATAGLSAWLGGALHYPDHIAAAARFVGADGQALGELRLPTVGPAERGNLTTLMRRAAAAPVPAGTRRIVVDLRSVDTDTSSSATADNVGLTLDVPPGGDAPCLPPTDPGGPARPGGAGGPGPVAGGRDRTAPALGALRLSRTRFAVAAPGRTGGRGGTRIAFTLSERARVTLRVQRKARGGRFTTVGTLTRTGSPGTNRVAFSGRLGRKVLRPGSHRLVVRAVDPAGNRSTERRRAFRIAR